MSKYMNLLITSPCSTAHSTRYHHRMAIDTFDWDDIGISPTKDKDFQAPALSGKPCDYAQDKRKRLKTLRGINILT